MNKDKNDAARGRLAAAVGLALCSTVANAQSPAPRDDRRIETLVVEGRAHEAEPTSGKFTAPLLDTPKSVTVVPAALIEARGATSLVDALKSVPGITFNAGEGGAPAGDNLKIRGFDAGADVFVDGVRDPGSQTRDVFALEQVEVVKGPGSAFTGRGAAGGSVNLVTKKPREEPFLVARVGAGTDAYARASLDGNWRLGDGAAFRLNVMSHEADVPGRDEVFLSHRGAAPSLAFGLGTPTRITLDYYYYRTDDMPDYSIPYGRNADNTAASGPPLDVDRENFYGLLNRDFQKTGADIRTLEIEHDFGGGLTLRNTTRYGVTSNDYIVTNPDDGRGNVVNGFVVRNAKSRNSETTTKANVTTLLGEAQTGRLVHSFAAGIEVGREEMYNRNYSVESRFNANVNADFANSCSAPGVVGAVSGYNCTTLANPNPHDPWTGTITPAGNATLAEADTTSIYAFDTIELGARWLLNLGLRYDDYSIRQLSGPIDSPELVENEADFWNHQLGIVYKPAANGSIYLSSGTSSNPSGNTLGDGTENLSESNADLDPERTRTLELGTKWELLDRRMLLTTAVFRMEKDNARVAIEPGRGAPQQNVGEQVVDGFELGVIGNVGERVQLFASYTHLDGEIVDDGPIEDNDGNRFPNTPEHSVSVWATYAVSPRLTLGAGASYVDLRYGNAANTVWIPSYTTYDAMASLELNERMELQLNVKNLTDEVYFVRPYSNHYAALGDARSAVMTLNVDF
ncbi:MAG TPA: TonB-dependent receptor [Gammaproteobacteria bacterium]